MISRPLSVPTGGLRRRQVLVAAGLTAFAPAVPALAACDASDQAASARGPADEVTYLTSFGIFGRDAHPFVAAQLGYFAEADLSVNVQSGPGAAQDKMAALLGGQAQFAAVDLSGAMIALGAGTTGCTTLAAVHQLFPAALMTADPEITTPQDLAGRTIAMPSGAIPDLLFPTYAREVGLDPDQVQRIDASPQQLPTLLATGRVDAIDQFVFGLPTVQAAVGDREVMMLSYSDVLSDLYGIGLMTTVELAVEQPELCVRFRDALLRGLDRSLTHPAEAGQILTDAEESVDPVVAAAELEIMDDYSRLVNVPLGAIDEIKLAKQIALLQSVGAIGDDFPGGMTAKDIITPDLVIPAG